MNNSKLQILFVIFIALVIGMNLLGGKITSLFGISVSVAIFITPLTFIIINIIEEVCSKKTARHFIVGGIISLIVIFIYTSIFVVLEPHSRYTFNQEYKTIFGSSLRMIIASLIIFILSQTHDSAAFEWWKKKPTAKFFGSDSLNSFAFNGLPKDQQDALIEKD